MMTMSTRVGIAELKAHLSEYVARAKAGERIVVCDRNTPVAELRATQERAPLPITQPTRSWPELAATLAEGSFDGLLHGRPVANLNALFATDGAKLP